MLIHPVQVNELYPIGSVVKAFAPPSDNWVLCDGQILSQSVYPILYALMDRPHPIFQNWEILKDSNLETAVGMFEVAYGNSLWVSGGDGYMNYTSDGETWSTVALSTYTDFYYGIEWNGTTFVSVPDYYNPTTNYVTSTNGSTWTERSLPVSIEAHAVAWDGTYFYLVDYNGINCMRSSDGTSWTAYTNLPDTTFSPLAASPDVVVTMSSSGIMAVSTDAMVTWKVYNCPRVGINEIEYDSASDIFVACGSGLYMTSPGDDGVNWDVRNLPIAEQGNQRSYYYRGSYMVINRIRKAGSYWFTLMNSSNQMAYSSDLETWETFPIPKAEWYDIFYNSTSGYYYVMGYGHYFLRWKEVTSYNTSTHFMLPSANDQHDWPTNIKMNKYIRVT